MQSSLNIFANEYLHKCKDTYFVLQNKCLCIDEDSFEAKTLRDDNQKRKYEFLFTLIELKLLF